MHQCGWRLIWCEDFATSGGKTCKNNPSIHWASNGVWRCMVLHAQGCAVVQIAAALLVPYTFGCPILVRWIEQAQQKSAHMDTTKVGSSSTKISSSFACSISSMLRCDEHAVPGPGRHALFFFNNLTPKPATAINSWHVVGGVWGVAYKGCQHTSAMPKG